MALVLLVIAVILVLIWIAVGYGAGGGTWRVHQLHVTSPDNQLVLGCNTGIISNVTTTGTVTYNLPDPAIARCNFILSEATSTQDIHSSVQLFGNLVLANDAARSILHGTAASQTGTHNLVIHGSDSAGSATGGAITIHAGESETGKGGDINLIVGAGGQVTVSGGPFVLSDDIEFSTTKDHYIKFESTGATTRSLTVQSLDTTGTAAGGDLALLAGKGGGDGGTVTVAGGDAQAATKTGGSVSIQAGKAGAGGSNGSISIGTESGSSPAGISLGNSTAGGTVVEAANDSGTGANLLVTGNVGPSAGLLTSDDTGYMRLRATGGATFVESGLKATIDSQAPLRFKPIVGSTVWWGMNETGKGNLVGEDTTSPTSLADTKAAFYTKGGAVVSEKLFVGKNAQVEGSLVTTPDANLIVTGNAGPTVSILSTVSGNLRLSASNATAANFIESGATTTAASARELRFTGIAGSPLWWTMNLNGEGNLAGESTKTPATIADTTNASLWTKGGGIVTKDLFIGGGLNLASGSSALNWYEETSVTMGFKFSGGFSLTSVDVLVTRIGRNVTLFCPANSTSSDATATGYIVSTSKLAGKFQPVTNVAKAAMQVVDNGNQATGAGLLKVLTDGEIRIYVNMSESSSFNGTAAVSGFESGWNITYNTSP